MLHICWQVSKKIFRSGKEGQHYGAGEDGAEKSPREEEMSERGRGRVEGGIEAKGPC